LNEREVLPFVLAIGNNDHVCDAGSYVNILDIVDGIFGCDAQEKDELFSRREDSSIVVTKNIGMRCAGEG
jgi:hypothetical protein